ncbi:MAG: hypothetical protein R3C16_05565 [Hyphomonadaceae bacterium]
MALVAVFVIAFAIVTGLQIKTHHEDAANTIIAAQASASGLIAERLNANLAVAMGAAAGVSELARSNGGVAPILMPSPAPPRTRRPPSPPRWWRERHQIEAITDPAHAQLVAAALRSAGAIPVWAGAPDMGELATAPVVVRRVGERAIVTVLNGAQLLPELEPNARVLIASPTGAILYASPAMQRAGARAQQQVLTAARSGSASALIRDGVGADLGRRGIDGANRRLPRHGRRRRAKLDAAAPRRADALCADGGDAARGHGRALSAEAPERPARALGRSRSRTRGNAFPHRRRRRQGRRARMAPGR